MTNDIDWNNKLTPKEGKYLEGPHSRWQELMFGFSVLGQFIKGFRQLHFVGPCITVFGSARFKEDHLYYKKAYEAGKLISAEGLTVLTGGGPGIMEAANRGAFENGGKSVGCNILLATEQKPNPYMHKWVTIKYFFTRKVLLVKYSYGFIVMPGGAGTMDEFFETMTLIQTATIQHFPLVLVGKEYYKDIWEMLQKMIDQKTISPEDLDLILFTDDINEAVNHIKLYIDNNYMMHRIKPRKIFMEKFF